MGIFQDKAASKHPTLLSTSPSSLPTKALEMDNGTHTAQSAVDRSKNKTSPDRISIHPSWLILPLTVYFKHHKDRLL